MRLKTAFAAMAVSSLAMMSMAKAVTIEVGYPYSALFDVTFKRIMPEFQKTHPDIEVEFRATYEDHEDATNSVLREAVADTLSNLSFQGLNRQTLLVDLRRRCDRTLQGRLLRGEPEQAHGRASSRVAPRMDRLSRRQWPRDHAGDLRLP